MILHSQAHNNLMSNLFVTRVMNNFVQTRSPLSDILLDLAVLNHTSQQQGSPFNALFIGFPLRTMTTCSRFCPHRVTWALDDHLIGSW